MGLSATGCHFGAPTPARPTVGRAAETPRPTRGTGLRRWVAPSPVARNGGGNAAPRHLAKRQ
eukprot:5891877-Alexandrium_andersonii.AAC.1